MERLGVAIFDGDDTLWLVEQLYDDALWQVEHLLDGVGLPGARWRVLQREGDLRNVHRLGMSPERFPLSSREALIEIGGLSDIEISPTLMNEVEGISRSVFEQKAPVLPDARLVLEKLQPDFHLVLLTKGDPIVQQKRVDDSGLAALFEVVEIVPEKDERIFRQLVSSFELQPDRAWSIGNSLASDINPALNAGLNAIWIDAHVWEHERRDIAPTHTRAVVLDSLADVPATLLSDAFGGTIRA